MTTSFNQVFKRLIGALFAISLGFFLLLAPFGETAEASKASMSGNYIEDTISVAQSLQKTVAIPNDDPSRSEAKDESLDLITAYISRYRNRPQFNKTVSFTTMQTALNAMAGHYKSFPNRPLPEALKDRLNNELSKAATRVSNEN